MITLWVLMNVKLCKDSENSEPEDPNNDVPDEEEAKREKRDGINYSGEGRKTTNNNSPNPSAISVFIPLTRPVEILPI